MADDTGSSLSARTMLGCASGRLDASGWSLIGANLVTIVIALARGWPLLEIMWIYWGQSVIIGFFNFLRIMNLRQFSTEGVLVNGRSVDPTTKTKVEGAIFFACHYGFFHAIYCVFLVAGPFSARDADATAMDLPFMAICLATFLANHAFSFAHNFQRDRQRCPNIGTVMLFPYARILPMHITIIIGSALAGGPVAIALFLMLKTGADLIMHAIEHSEARLPELPEGEQI
jgi:hypothetical protein